MASEDDSSASVPSPPDPIGSMPPPIDASPGSDPTNGLPKTLPEDETKRQRRKRERAEEKQRRREEKQLRRSELEAQRVQRAEEKALAEAEARKSDAVDEADRERSENEFEVKQVPPTDAPDSKALPEADDDAWRESAEALREDIAGRRRRDDELRTELELTESRIETNRSRTEQALEEARARLELIEAQAGEAEERAERAERLAELRDEEQEREHRLHEMLERIDRAEQRARDAEARARQAVAGIKRPPDLEAAQSAESPSEPASPESPDGALAGSPADRGNDEEDAGTGDPAAEQADPAFEDDGDPESPEWASPARADAPTVPISLNEATFEQLRDAGLSVTQTGRVLAHRERADGFVSLDELDEIPGFSPDFLEQVKPRLTA